MIRHQCLGLLGALLVASAASGCVGQQVCTDVIPNATITDVLYDPLTERLYVSLFHSLSYCTGTDESRYSTELIEVDLRSGQVAFQQRAGNSIAHFDVPESSIALFQDSELSSARCPSCELVLRTDDEAYTFHFTSDPDWDPVMTLDVLVADEPLVTPLVTIDIGDYVSRVHQPEGTAPLR